MKILNFSANELDFISETALSVAARKLTLMEELNLANNKFSMLPNNFSQLANLSYVNLANNHLKVFPNVDGLQHLRMLILSDNLLTLVPGLNLPVLEVCELANNAIDTISDQLKLPKLKRMIFQNNNLLSVPEAISFPLLLSLDLSSQHQLSTIPKSLLGAQNLQSLYLDRNQISNLPTDITSLTNLTYLNLSYNPLSEFVIQQILKLTNLRSISLRAAKLKQLPAEISLLRKLRELDVADNQLSFLPPSLGQIDNLETLIVSYNQ